MRTWKAASVFVVVGALLGFVGAELVPLSTAIAPQDRAAIQAPVMPRELTSYRDVVKKVLPAVVSIQVTSRSANRVSRRPADDFDPFGGSPLPDSDLRRQFEEFRRRQQEENLPRGQFGSGVIVDPKGIVVTNNHVVAGAEQVEVILKDGRRLVSKAVFTDPKTDVAIVKLNSAIPLPYIEFADSDAMEIGDRVLAVGAPFGLAGSVTHGIISGKGRPLGGTLLYEDFLQTDAPINPGNSGGPLINLEGKIIGINTAIRTQNGGFQGVGMAIPSSIVQGVATQLAEHGTVRRGYLGIQMSELDQGLAERLGISGQKGLVVGRIYNDTPAAKAGLKEGDVIVAVDGKPLESSRALQLLVERAAIGKPIALTIYREGKRENLKVTVEQQPDTYGLAQTEAPPSRQPRRPTNEEAITLDRIGIEVTDLTAEIAEQLGYRDGKGVVITRVEAGSLGQFVGLRRGMLIAQAEKKPVESAAQLKELLSKSSLEQGILLLVRAPQGITRYIVIRDNS
jgi:serine protease Do